MRNDTKCVFRYSSFPSFSLVQPLGPLGLIDVVRGTQLVGGPGVREGFI